MKDQKIRLTLNSLIVILGFVTCIAFVLCVGGGGVLNDLNVALKEMQDLERNNLLESPPDNISPITKFQIKNFQNSAELEEYAHETDQRLSSWEQISLLLVGLTVLMVIARVFFQIRIRRGSSKRLPAKP